MRPQIIGQVQIQKDTTVAMLLDHIGWLLTKKNWPVGVTTIDGYDQIQEVVATGRIWQEAITNVGGNNSEPMTKD